MIRRERGAEQRWNKIFHDCGSAKPQYDDWLDKYQALLDASTTTPIIDLGCGYGNDTLYLTERGYPVIACDYAQEALRRLRSFIPEPQTRQFNLLDGLPFPDAAARIIIADLSLHYFAWDDTKGIVTEIARVLTSGGHLLAGVNSVNDVQYGAGQGIMFEANYYDIGGKFKRFFDEDQLLQLFDGWEVVVMRESEMRRYDKPKVVWEIAVKK